MDDLARWVASPVSRRRSLKLGAGAFAGMAIGSLLPRTAFAPPTAFAQGGSGNCIGPGQNCFAITCKWPASTCCHAPNLLHKPENDCGVYCCNPCNPTSSQCGPDGHCVAGPVAENCPCSGYNGDEVCGNGCCRGGLYAGNVCCDRIFTFKSPSCCTPKDQMKGACKDMKYLTGIETVAFGALATVATGGLVIVFGLAAAGFGFANQAFDICGEDPPDPNFKAIYVPTVPRLPRLRAGKELTPKAVRALRRMTANHVRCSSYTIAWIHSIEKAQGAAQANDDQWARRHRAAAATYARTAASALEREHGLRSNARRELRRGGFHHFKITPAHARTWQRQIKAHGLPSQMEHILREAKVDTKQRQALRHDLLQMDPMVVAHLGLFGELDDKRFQQANTAMVRSMRQSATLLSAGA